MRILRLIPVSKVLALAGALVLALAGCTTASRMNIGDGVEAVYADCGASFLGMRGCIGKVNEMCPNGWLPLAAKNELEQAGMMYNPWLGGYQPVAHRKRELMAFCK